MQLEALLGLPQALLGPREVALDLRVEIVARALQDLGQATLELLDRRLQPVRIGRRSGLHDGRLGRRRRRDARRATAERPGQKAATWRLGPLVHD